MIAHAPETIARRLIEDGFNAANADVADELIADDLVEHQWFGPEHASGPEGVKAVIRSLHRAFSDFHLEIEDVAVAGDVVWLRMTGSGTHDGAFMGHGPTGRKMATPVFDALRVEGGKIVEHWGVPDRLYALVQLGLMTPPARQPASPPAM
jgi:predicted ester cyclase